MLVLGLLICVVLRALSTHATVVQSFSGCNPFFYKGTEPRGMDQNARNICQELEHGGFYYASLYSVHHKIPLYSAYTLDQECRSATGRTDNWHVEPQVNIHASLSNRRQSLQFLSGIRDRSRAKTSKKVNPNADKQMTTGLYMTKRQVKKKNSPKSSSKKAYKIVVRRKKK